MHKMSDENNEGIVMPKTTSDKPVVEQETHQPEIIAESSPASEENHEQKTDGVQTRINTLTAKRYQETRRADEAEAELAKLRSQATSQPVIQTEQLTAPALPEDQFDEDAMREYHKANQKYYTEVAQSAAKNQFESQQANTLKQAQEAKFKTSVDKYSQNAVRDGVDFDKLLVAEKTLKQNGLSNELGQYLLNDTNGAKIVEYLNDNPADMHDILSLDPVSAGIRIATEIKPKVLSSTPKVSGAPDPIPEVKGGGYLKVDDFDKKYPGAEII